MRKQHQKLLSDRLQSTFYRLVEENSGTISVYLLVVGCCLLLGKTKH
ncbi:MULTISPECIES: hypothetical protein [Fischerella]|nr:MULTISPECIES: hypothetical protein [Fischerella]